MMADINKAAECLACGGESLVRYTRHTVRGTIRGRECSECGNRFCTLETRLAGPERLDSAIPVIDLIEAIESCGIAVDRSANI